MEDWAKVLNWEKSELVSSAVDKSEQGRMQEERMLK